MFFRICNYEIIQKIEDQPENVSTVRQIQWAFHALHTSTQQDPIDLVHLLRFRVTRMLVHIIRTNHGIFYTTNPMGSLYRQGSDLGGC